MDHLAGLMAAYRAAGAAVTDVVELDVLEQGEGAAIVAVHWHVRGPGGATVRDFRTSYQLVGPRPWRILG